MLPSLSARRGSGNTAIPTPTKDDRRNITAYATNASPTSTPPPTTTYQQPPASPRTTHAPSSSSYGSPYIGKETYHHPPLPSPSSSSGGYGPRTPSRLRFKSTTPSSSSASSAAAASASYLGPGGRNRLNSFEEEESDQVARSLAGYGDDDDGSRNGQVTVSPAVAVRSRRNDGGSSSSQGTPTISSPTNFRHVGGSGIIASAFSSSSDTTKTIISPTRPTHQNTDPSNTFQQPRFTHSSSLPNTRQTRGERETVVVQSAGIDEFGRVPSAAAGGMAGARTWSASSPGHGHGEEVAAGGQLHDAGQASNGDDATLALGSPLEPTSLGQQQQHHNKSSSGSGSPFRTPQQTTVSEVGPPSSSSSAVTWSQTLPFGNDDTRRSAGERVTDVRSASSSVSGPSGMPSGASTQLHTPRTPFSLYPSSGGGGGGGKYNEDVSQHLRQQSLQGPPSSSSGVKLQYSTPQPPGVAGVAGVQQQQAKPRERGASEGWDKERRKAGWFANVARSTIGIGGGERRHSEEKEIVEGGEKDTARWRARAGEGRKMSDPAAGRRGSSPIDESAVMEEEEPLAPGGSVMRKKSIQRMRSLVGGGGGSSSGGKQSQSRNAAEEATIITAARGGEPSGSSLGSFLRKHSFSSSSSTSRRPNMRGGGGSGESLSPVRPTGLQISAPIGVLVKLASGDGIGKRLKDEETQKASDSDASARLTTPSYASPVSQAFLPNANTAAAVQQQPGFPTPLSPPRRVSPDEDPTWSTPRANRKQPPIYIPSTPSDSSHQLQSSTASYPSRMEQGTPSVHHNSGQKEPAQEASKAPVQGRRSDESERRRDQDVLPSTPQRSAVPARPGRIIPPPLSLHQALGASLRQPYEFASEGDADTEDTEDQSSILDYDDVVIERAERIMTPSRVRKDDRNAPSTPEPPPPPSSQLMPSPMTFSDLTQQIVDISVSCRGQADAGGPSDEYEEFSWNVVIRRKRIPLDSPSTNESMSPSTSPMQLSSVPSHTVVPTTASSINLSLNLHQPAGKLVFISIPAVADIPSAGRRISHSAAYGPAISKIANARIERSPSPSPASSRQFASGEALLSPKNTTFCPARTNPSFNKPALVPAPSESAESFDEALGSPLPGTVNAGFAYPMGQQAGQQLHAAASPPASPRDLMMRRRKASLQGGVLYTRGL